MQTKTLDKGAKTAFKMLAGINRPVTPAQVTKLAKSIETMGIIRPIVIATIEFITGKREKYIIDGQHLFHALMRLNMDFPYVEIKVENEKDLVQKIALLNASSKSWCSLDYITAWKYVKSDYKIIERLFNTYDLELMQIIEICHTGTLISVRGNGSNPHSKIMKSGEAVVRNEAYTIELLDRITDVLKIVPRMDRVSNKLFIATYVQFSKNIGGYNHKEFLTWLTANKTKFATVTGDPEQIKKLLNKSVA